jgi:hypothetical protein
MEPEKLLEEDQLIGMRPAREAPVRTIVHSLNERGVSYCKYLQRHVACACKAHFLPYLVEAESALPPISRRGGAGRNHIGAQGHCGGSVASAQSRYLWRPLRLTAGAAARAKMIPEMLKP